MKDQETWGDGSHGLGHLLSMGRQLSASWTVDSRWVRQMWGRGGGALIPKAASVLMAPVLALFSPRGSAWDGTQGASGSSPHGSPGGGSPVRHREAAGLARVAQLAETVLGPSVSPHRLKGHPWSRFHLLISMLSLSGVEEA